MRILTCFALIYIFFIGLSLSSANATEQTHVVVSIAPQKYLVDAITGGTLPVTVLVVQGADPHSYEPTPMQMRACVVAKVYFTIGVPFESMWLPRLKGIVADLPIVSTISGITRIPLTDAGHSHGEHLFCNCQEGEDPHVWLSPEQMKKMIPIIEETLCNLQPEQAPLYQKNAETLKESISKLQKDLHALLDPVPAEKKFFLTFHPSWRYFAQEFSLTELSIEVEGKEPGPKTMMHIIQEAESHGLVSVIVEPQFPKNSAQAIAENLKARVVVIDPLKEDWPSTLQALAEIIVEDAHGKK